MSYYVTGVAVELVDKHAVYIKTASETIWLATCKDSDTAKAVAEVVALKHRLPIQEVSFSARHRKKTSASRYQ